MQLAYLYDAILVHRVSWQRQLNVIRYLARGSLGTRARRRRTFDVLNYGYNYGYN